jgi:5-formyltetrahydrofolate cyclo-ligase
MRGTATYARPMTRDTADATKRELRRALLERRRSLSPAGVAAASQAIEGHLRTLPELAPGRDRTLLLYAADPDEVALDGLITTPPAGWTVLLPRVEGGAIVAVPHRSEQGLVVGHRGIREPLGDAVDAAAVDVVIVPGVAYSPSGERLGRGAGMYDRLLPGLGRAVRIGVCMEEFVVDALPVEPHDAVVDLVVTDASVRRNAATGRTSSA